MTEIFTSDGGWDVLAAARRPIDAPEHARFLHLDLNDSEDSNATLGAAIGRI